MSSVSEKSSSYMSSNHHHGHAHGHHHHHTHHHHPQQHYIHQREDEDDEEEDEFEVSPRRLLTTDFLYFMFWQFSKEEEDLTANRLGGAATHIVDHSHIYGVRDPQATTTYATMPRKPANGVTTVVNNSATYRRGHQHYVEERRRQAYIQSLGMQLLIVD